MPHPIRPRGFRSSALCRSNQATVRAADVVLAVALVAVASVVCLMLVGRLIGPGDALATTPTSAQPS